MSSFLKKHHVRGELCTSRAKYREGRELNSVKVYTINDESRYLLVQGVPALGAQRDLMKTCSQYGTIEEHKVLHHYPSEAFTEVHSIKYQNIQSARVAKRKLDDSSFYGGVLHICYAPESESVDETRHKLQERRKSLARRIAQLDAEKGKKCLTVSPSSFESDAQESGPLSLDYQTELQSNQDQVPQAPPHQPPPPPWNAPPPQHTHPPLPRYAPPAEHENTSQKDLSCPGPGAQRLPHHQHQSLAHHDPHVVPRQLPLPPQNMPPWQRPPPSRAQLDHARVPSSHATLPPFENQAPPWQQSHGNRAPWQPSSGNTCTWQPSSGNTSAWQPPPGNKPLMQPPPECTDKTSHAARNEHGHLHGESNKQGPGGVHKSIRQTLSSADKKSDVLLSKPAKEHQVSDLDQPSITICHDSQDVVIKHYKSNTNAIPKFVPRQITKRDIPGLNKEAFRETIKDAVNESLRKNAFILEDMKGPDLPNELKEKHKTFKASDMGDISMDTSTATIRSKVRQFSTGLIPRQLKKQKTS